MNFICFKDEDEEILKYVECFFCGRKFKERGIKNHERKCEENYFKFDKKGVFIFDVYIL